MIRTPETPLHGILRGPLPRIGVDVSKKRDAPSFNADADLGRVDLRIPTEFAFDVLL